MASMNQLRTLAVEDSLAVSDYLRQQGIGEHRLAVAGFGSQQPIASNQRDADSAAAPDGLLLYPNLGAEEIPGTTDLEVTHGNFETSSQGTVLFDGVDSFSCITVCDHVSRQKQQCVGSMVGSTNASAQLI